MYLVRRGFISIILKVYEIEKGVFVLIIRKRGESV